MIKAQASADVTSEEQIWMRKQGKRLKKLRGDVSFFRFPLNPTSEQVPILVQSPPNLYPDLEPDISGGAGDQPDQV